MRSYKALRLLAATCLTATSAFAQQAPPVQATEGQGGATPPARVGRLAALQGTVSFHASGSDGWVAATQNYPVTTGDGVFAQSGGHAEIDVGRDIVELDGGSELDVASLDDQQFVASEPQGRAFLALGPQAPNAVTTVATPRGTVQLAGQGEYEVVAGDSNTPTTVTVLRGSASLTATGVSLQIPAGQTATVTGTDQLSGGVAQSGAPDPFASAMAALVERDSGALPPAVANMTGCQSLAHVGTWRASPQYGQVWYPPVQAGWTPYREGHWAYVEPWGWTWVDDESWGFAPFHYGRWIDEDGQWGWSPGEGGVPVESYAEPVYAPALVSWTDVGAAALAGAAVGALAAGAVGWIPLGPNEPYYPPYHYDRRYFDRVNRVDVRNIRNVSITNVHVTNNFNRFVNRRGATIAPAEALRRGQPIGGVARPFTPGALAQARPLPGGRHVLAAPPRPRGEPGRGPAINPAAFHPQHLQGGRLPFRAGPPERPGVPVPAAARPALPERGAERGALPALRPHEQVVTGRPGAVPPAPGPHGPEGARPEPGVRPEPGHPGLVAGAAAGAADAGLAAHTLAHGPGHPGPSPAIGRPPPQAGRPVEPHPPAPHIVTPHPVPHFAAPRPAPAPHFAAPRPAPTPHFAAPRPAPAPHFAAPRPAPAPHFAAPRPAPAPHFAPPRPAPAPRPAARGPERPH